MNDDWFDLLASLLDGDARFLVVGAHALAVHGHPRATQDIDVWVDPDPDNAVRVWRALVAFGAPVGDIGVTTQDFEQVGIVVQLGLPPNRIDLMTAISGVMDFESAWRERITTSVRGRDVPFIGRAALLANKRASGRKKDLADVETLEQ